MPGTIPGINLPFENNLRDDTFSRLRPILEATGGITLSQLCALTGIESTTVQNWIKRGWIESTKGKKYTEVQIVRIILFNMLRSAMQLDKIAQLMHYVNGEVEEHGDDILPDSELYNLLCSVIYRAEELHCADSDALKTIIAEKIVGYDGEAAQKLANALLIMSLAYISSRLKREMENEYNRLM